MTHYSITPYMNESEYHFGGYLPGHTVQEVMAFDVLATSPLRAAEQMWTIGNRMGADVHGAEWPTNVRSLSVGDVLKVFEHDYTKPHGPTWYAVASFGWDEIAEPTIVAA